jgi:hypothetical protein
MKVHPSLVTKFWTDMHGPYMGHSFVLHKEGLRSDWPIGIAITLCLLITGIFVGLGRKSTVFIFCCCIVFLVHLILSTNYHFPAFIIFLAVTFEVMDGGFTLYAFDSVYHGLFLKN